MSDSEALDLESTIRRLPGVLGCVILNNHTDGAPEEIQAFVRSGSDRGWIQELILAEADRRDLQAGLKNVLVFELQAESHLGDRESLKRAVEVAEQDARAKGHTGAVTVSGDQLDEEEEALAPLLDRRPKLDRVLLSSTSWHSEAQVSLGPEGEEVLGHAQGDKTPHGLKVLAQATLEAASRLAGGIDIELKGASLVSTFDRQAILVIVQVQGSPETVGAALVRGGPISEAAVRATLDALNRRIAYGG